MPQLHFYVPKDIEQRLREKARMANLPLSRFLAELAKREIGHSDEWPAGYFDEVFGQWQGEPLTRAPQGDYESRRDLE